MVSPTSSDYLFEVDEDAWYDLRKGGREVALTPHEFPACSRRLLHMEEVFDAIARVHDSTGHKKEQNLFIAC